MEWFIDERYTRLQFLREQLEGLDRDVQEALARIQPGVFLDSFLKSAAKTRSFLSAQIENLGKHRFYSIVICESENNPGPLRIPLKFRARNSSSSALAVATTLST
jgi:hypothetical protein